MGLRRFSTGKFAEIFTRNPSRSRRGPSSLRLRLAAIAAILGPGLIATSSGNEASGIATYSFAGAEYGFSLLWAFIPMTIFFILAQEMCVRMGVVTGQGLSDLIREHFGVRWTAVVISALVLANTGIVIAQFVGIAQASQLFGIPAHFTVPLAGLVIWWLVVRGTPKRIEQAFLLMSLVFLIYIASAFFGVSDWGEVGKGFVAPDFKTETAYLFMVIALIGTTITPFMQVFVQSSVVEKGLTKDDLPLARADAISGVVIANTIAIFIVISAAATLHATGTSPVCSDQGLCTEDLWKTFVPVVGAYAPYIFGIGLLGASMLAMGVLPLATAYSVSEALGLEKGLSNSFKEAPAFLGIFTSLIAIGVVVALLPGIDYIWMLLTTQFLNGLLLPIILSAIVLLSSNKELMGEHANGKIFKGIAWAMTVIISAISIFLLVITALELFGYKF
jgi:NRAMP (natural resistance-associated macrophage protein)-like metal ion transporter